MKKSANSSKKSTTGDQRTKFLDSITIIVDPDALTLEEICDAKAITINMAEGLIRDNLKMGTWEQVLKKGRNRMQKAYRLRTGNG